MIVTGCQPEMKEWLCARIKLTHPAGLRCIGNVFDGELRGVVGFDNFNEASIFIHVAGSGNWLTKDFLRAVFDYPFNVCKVNMVIGLISTENRKVWRLCERVGFSVRTRLEGAHSKGDLLVTAMPRSACRFLKD